MRLSVIIPVHNAQNYLPQCLDSIIEQKIEDMEIICVDDASSDDSVKVIEAYQQKDARIHLLKNEVNSYAGACRNRGLSYAKGEYVHFLDADDLVEEHAYEAYLDAAERLHPDMIKGTASCFDNDTGEITIPPLFGLTKIEEDKFDRILDFHEDPQMFSRISVVPWNGMYRREFLIEKSIRFNSLICVNDRSFYNEASILAEKILLLKHPIVKYRINNGQSLMGNRARNFDCQFRSYELVLKQCKENDISVEEQKIILHRELTDLFLWYRRYVKFPEIQDKLREQTFAFVQTLDLSIFGEELTGYGWYKTCHAIQNRVWEKKKKAKKQPQEKKSEEEAWKAYMDPILLQRLENPEKFLSAESLEETYELLQRLQKELKANKIWKSFEKAYANAALKLCINCLRNAASKEAFIHMADRFREEIAYKLGILGHTRPYFQDKADFSYMMRCFEVAAETLWEENTMPAQSVFPEISMEEWKAPICSEEASFIKMSVIIPMYNVEGYIGEVLESLFCQTLKEFEIICVDDGSTDRTVEILKEYQKKDARIQLFCKENGGASSARNVGIQHARGKYIQFLDSDDLLHEKALEFLYYEAEKDALDLLFYGARVFFENEEVEKREGRYRNYYKRKAAYPGVQSGKEMFCHMSENKEFKPTPCLQIIRREYLKQTGITFFEGIIHEDHIYTMECMALAERVGYRNVPLYIRRVRSGSVMTGSKAFYHAYSLQKGVEEMLCFAKKHRLDEDLAYFEALLTQLGRNSEEAEKYLSELGTEELWENLKKLPDAASNALYIYMYQEYAKKERLKKECQENENQKCYQYKREAQMREEAKQAQLLLKETIEKEENMEEKESRSVGFFQRIWKRK